MARKAEGRTFNVSVIGLSGTEREKGQYGVGKSCLCNRFLKQVADHYHQEHISVLSQIDFAGRVINNDHFLYWGSVVKTDDGNNFTFHVVEQTEFIDDVSFSPFKSARTEAYVKRAVSGKLQSAEKLMYICKDQLGMETDSAYPQVLMPEGKLTIDGFLCCFDVSHVPQRSIEKQVEFVAALLNNAAKTKKPVVLATTKGDSSSPEYVKEAERLLNRKEFRGSVSLVETSAHENINVEAAFLLLAHLIGKTKPKHKILPFADARRQRHELLEVAKEAYIHLLRTNVSDPKAVWPTWRKRLEAESDFGHYVDLFGTEQARKEFRAHTKRLRDELVRLREQRYLSLLPALLKLFLPTMECITERGWNTIRRLIKEHPDFERHFVIIDEENCSSWKQADRFLDDTSEHRIPFDLLNSAEAEMCFRNHLNELQAQHRKKELQLQFKKLLEENPQVTPGKPLSETYVFFLGKECYISLEDHERVVVYEQHMIQLRAAARAQFQELLWEKSHVFLDWNTSERLTSITAALQDDKRYKALHRLEEDREAMILNHLGFMQAPAPERCGFGVFCIDMQVENLLASRAIRPELKSSSDSVDSGTKTLNLVLLGKDGLAISLNREIRNLCTDDEYRLENVTYSLDYRPIDGDVSREQNALATANFKPHGCLCVYNSEDTLNYVQNSLERSLKDDVVKEGEATLSGMPIAIIQASNSSQSEKESERLRERGRNLAARLHGDFIVDYDDIEEGAQFVEAQIHAALQTIVRGCSPGLNSWYLSEQFEPDIRLSMCLMCGDPFPLDLPLGPLLNHDMCRVLADTPYCITLDLFLASELTCKQKVEVEVSSYHGGPRLHQGLFHGQILVYSAKRKASLATLRAFTENLLEVPKLVLAIADSGGVPSSSFFSSDICQSLIQEGQQLASSLGANFMTTTANFTQQTTVYEPFFKLVWEKREESESLYHEPAEEPCPPAYSDKVYFSRPPAPLPKPFIYQTHKSSTSNSTDSEPVYDQPNLFHTHYSDSDHEADRGSSVSPPPPHLALGRAHHVGRGDEEIYSEVTFPGTINGSGGDQLVKPSYVKSRKNVYAGSKWEHRKSLPIMPLGHSLGSEPGGNSNNSTPVHFPLQQQHHIHHHAGIKSNSNNNSFSTTSSSGGSIASFSYQGLSQQQQQQQQHRPYATGSHNHHFLYKQQQQHPHHHSSAGNSPSQQPLVKDPQEYFRKSCSMKIAAEEAVEAGDEAEEDDDEDEEDTDNGAHGGERKAGRRKAARAWALNERRRKKGETFPPALRRSSSGDNVWPDNSTHHGGRIDQFSQGGSKSSDVLWSENDDNQKATSRRKMMAMRSQSQTVSMFRPQQSQVTAPLAKPEHIEIADYCSVHDAVPPFPIGDNDYQIVEDALPPGQLQRIRSTKSPLRTKGHTDSEDSEFSSLERLVKQPKSNKRGVPHRRKSKQRQESSNNSSAIYSSPMPSVASPRQYGFRSHKHAVQSQSPSEDGSDGTGDEILLAPSNKKEVRRRSFNHRKWRTPSSKPATSQVPASPTISESDQLLGSSGGTHMMKLTTQKKEHVGTTVGPGVGEEAEFELNDSGNFGGSKFRFRTMRDPEKQRKKDERRRQKEEVSDLVFIHT
ncbi:rho GTPase-activating protein [Plakobranchus ocellatus]|uniref:Rho GTPase-activating protein n=1 Tax=Plakobranchus ocellatus TaxID=259542 RepID=A0AAV3ZN49_9GAST|nr:rho GTPase-activating protein [Plakobranchus ocellatus]